MLCGQAEWSCRESEAAVRGPSHPGRPAVTCSLARELFLQLALQHFDLFRQRCVIVH